MGWFVSYRESGTGRIEFNGRNEWVEQPTALGLSGRASYRP